MLIPKLDNVFNNLCSGKYNRNDCARFISKINMSPGLGPWGNCWEWSSRLSKKGYGQFGCSRHNKKINHSSHRVSYEMFTGKLLGTYCACHKCDNRKCVNPTHLFPGTILDNNIDRDNKGRNNALRGEEHNMSKLTWAQVHEIRKLYNTTTLSFVKLAKMFQVSYVEISYIVNNSHWHDVSYIQTRFRKGYRKLNNEDLIEICKLHKSSNLTHAQLGDMFSTNRKLIGKIVNGTYKCNE